MIDLHSHILPGVDDGAENLSVSLEMARKWAADGVTTVACTPHILPGLYGNTGPGIRLAAQETQRILDRENIALRLVTGADATSCRISARDCDRATFYRSLTPAMFSSSRRITWRRLVWRNSSST